MCQKKNDKCRREAKNACLHPSILLPDFASANTLGARKVGAKVLYMSGYIDDQRVMGPGEHFIGKPFSSAALLQTIREVLHEPPRGATAAIPE